MVQYRGICCASCVHVRQCGTQFHLRSRHANARSGAGPRLQPDGACEVPVPGRVLQCPEPYQSRHTGPFREHASVWDDHRNHDSGKANSVECAPLFLGAFTHRGSRHHCLRLVGSMPESCGSFLRKDLMMTVRRVLVDGFDFRKSHGKPARIETTIPLMTGAICLKVSSMETSRLSPDSVVGLMRSPLGPPTSEKTWKRSSDQGSRKGVHTVISSAKRWVEQDLGCLFGSYVQNARLKSVADDFCSCSQAQLFTYSSSVGINRFSAYV
jgi:hypothetical protein